MLWIAARRICVQEDLWAAVCHLEKQIYQRNRNKSCHVLTARNIEEASKLIEAGFEFIYEYQGVMIYRKRK